MNGRINKLAAKFGMSVITVAAEGDMPGVRVILSSPAARTGLDL